ncbi:MAG TPA: CBS domain-containing protein [Polyangiaceae bacterium]
MAVTPLRNAQTMLTRMAAQLNVGQVLIGKAQGVWTVPPHASVFEAIYQMAEHNVGALPVVNEGKVVGILSERDYARKLILSGRSSLNTPVHEVMTTDIVTISENATLEECMRLMTEYKIRHLPVMRNDTLFGIVSIGDLVYELIAQQEQVIDELQRYVTG